ncbi:MAG: phosphate ABC transporter permease subunit PstC [Desemzia incerta]|uniref:Phosphate transport system permease protein n=1 Tax=Desemzia incerta TaxID=82801 RepID=A0A1I5XNT3_9LACT|nr:MULTISPECIES: phosphate ABC transporter permease subunit PstC [Desemzia]MCI3029052.1 phosphate ABC transporter permease subunit PstC [Desemzia sp. C1]WHZ31057.1 phosphate ABC transporter permease subunit PstC [Desemzia incerta]SFQ33594.1 phosphate ABC transporter membrane protein 1, PhoT family [Desemzia incerta]
MKAKKVEGFMQGVFLISALLSVLSIILIIIFMFAGGVPFMLEYGIADFLFGDRWSPSNTPASFGILPMILGSIFVTLGAIVIGVPIGILTAVFMAEFCPPKLHRWLKPAVNLMAAIPSIVYGFFALQLIVPIMRNFSGGTGMNMLTAMILLGVMILPTVIGLSESSLRSVPRSYYTGSMALGATHERTVMKVIMPAAKSGIISSIILGVGRAIGETMAVVLIAGNQPIIPQSITSGVRTLTTNIVLEMAYAAGEHREALIATGVVLFVFILIINGVFMFIKRKESRA